MCVFERARESRGEGGARGARGGGKGKGGRKGGRGVAHASVCACVFPLEGGNGEGKPVEEGAR